jgi:hypothetical protein
MDDEALVQFTAITDATPEQAERYLQLTDGNLEQAVQLYFEDPSLGAEHASSTTASRDQQTTSTVPSSHIRNTEPEVIQIDSDDDSDVQMFDEAPAIPDTADDAEMARRLQEEMYGATSGVAADNVEDIRAPMARTRETLVGGADLEEMNDADISALVQQQILGRQRRANGSKCLAKFTHGLETDEWLRAGNIQPERYPSCCLGR